MKQLLTFVIFISSVCALFGTNSTQVTKQKKVRLSVEQRLARAGGLVEKQGSQKGKIAFIDVQSRLAATNITSIVKSLATESKLNFVYEKANSFKEPSDLKTASDADFAVIIIDDPKKPTSLISPDDKWALINISQMDRNLKTENAKKKFFESRCRRQILRIYSIAAGGWASSFPGNISSPNKLEDLDLVGEFIPEDVKQRNMSFLKYFGMTPKIVATYRKACREGWAPAPTNDVQKAIWDKVRATPKNPMKIKFDPKKRR